MRLVRFTLPAVLMLLVSTLSVFAQNINVSGQVVDNNKVPLPGAAVVIKGTQKGVTTDLDGKYTISAPKESVLEFTCIGYASKEEAVGGRTRIDVVLAETSDYLDEVVFVAYGQQKKESVVAAITSIDSKGLKQTPASNIGEALEGSLTGLTVIQRSGVPGGENMEFYIRGRSTVNGQNPLTLVDGVERDFTALDPREI